MRPVAPRSPNEPDTVEEARQHPEAVAGISIDDSTAHYASIIGALEETPVIIGQSFGGLITEKLLGSGMGVAGVAIYPAQIKGVLPLPLAQLRAGLPAWATRPTCTGPSPSPRASSGSASETPSPRRSLGSTMNGGRSHHRPGRCFQAAAACRRGGPRDVAPTRLPIRRS